MSMQEMSAKLGELQRLLPPKRKEAKELQRDLKALQKTHDVTTKIQENMMKQFSETQLKLTMVNEECVACEREPRREGTREGRPGNREGKVGGGGGGRPHGSVGRVGLFEERTCAFGGFECVRVRVRVRVRAQNVCYHRVRVHGPNTGDASR